VLFTFEEIEEMLKLFRLPAGLPFSYTVRNASGSVELPDPQFFEINTALHTYDDKIYVIESKGDWYTKDIIKNIFYLYPRRQRMDHQYLLDNLLKEEKMMKEKMMSNLLIFREFYHIPVGLPELFAVIGMVGFELIKRDFEIVESV